MRGEAAAGGAGGGSRSAESSSSSSSHTAAAAANSTEHLATRRNQRHDQQQRQQANPQHAGDHHSPRRRATHALPSASAARRRQLRRRFWTEKLVVTADALQLYALLWQLSQPWPWPARWLRATRWVNALALDALSFRATGAAMGATAQPFSLWGEMRGYWLLALLWAALPACACLLLRAAAERWRRAGRADFLVAAAQLENALLAAFQFLYVPIGLAALRLVNCDASGAVSVDPLSLGRCWSARHTTAVLIVPVSLGGSFLLGFPWLLRDRIRRFLPHPSVERHERFMRSKELEFALGTSETYLELYLPLHASFARHSAETPVEMCALKLFVLLAFSLLRSEFPSRANQGRQMALVVAALAAFALRRSLRACFRVRSTARLAWIADWGLVVNGMLGVLSASGVRSALTVATTMASCLAAINVCFAAAITLSLLHSAHEWIDHRNESDTDASAESWCCWWWAVPAETADALGDAESAVKQPVETLQSPPPTSATTTAPSLLLLLEWIDAISHAKELCFGSLLVAPSMRSAEGLGAALQRLTISHAEALRTRHLLTDQLSEIMVCVSELYVDALASSPFRAKPFPSRELAELNRALQKRDERQALLSMQSRRVLSKMEAARAWKVPPMAVDEFSRGECLEQERVEEVRTC